MALEWNRKNKKRNKDEELEAAVLASLLEQEAKREKEKDDEEFEEIVTALKAKELVIEQEDEVCYDCCCWCIFDGESGRRIGPLCPHCVARLQQQFEQQQGWWQQRRRWLSFFPHRLFSRGGDLN